MSKIYPPPIWYKSIYTIKGVFLDIIINIGYLIEFQAHVVFSLEQLQNSGQNLQRLLKDLLGGQSTI
jgi:hypothetical protein